MIIIESKTFDKVYHSEVPAEYLLCGCMKWNRYFDLDNNEECQKITLHGFYVTDLTTSLANYEFFVCMGNIYCIVSSSYPKGSALQRIIVPFDTTYSFLAIFINELERGIFSAEDMGFLQDCLIRIFEIQSQELNDMPKAL